MLYRKKRLKIVASIIACSTMLHASQYGPGLLFDKPYPTDPYLSDFDISFSAGQTNLAYNEQGQAVSYLEEYGIEDLLKKFIDPDLPNNDIESIGTIRLDGTFHFQQLNIGYLKNIHHDFFIGIITSIRNLNVTNINSDIQLTANLTPDEMHNLATFESKLPRELHQSGMFYTLMEFGYNKKLTNFESIDFLQILLKSSICTPQWMTGSPVAALEYPIGSNFSMSYPSTFIMSCGIADHVTFGLYALCIPIQSKDMQLPVNTTTTNNQIILTESTRVKLVAKPLFSTVGYMELYNVIPKLVTTVGYGYMYGMPWRLQSYDEQHFPSSAINNSSILHEWNITSMFVQLDYEFPSKTNPQSMALSLFCTIPMAGKLYPIMTVFGGAYALSFTYKF